MSNLKIRFIIFQSYFHIIYQFILAILYFNYLHLILIFIQYFSLYFTNLISYFIKSLPLNFIEFCLLIMLYFINFDFIIIDFEYFILVE